jgi:RHS repeat-associated protein
MDPWGHVVDETLGTTMAVRIQSTFDAVTSWLGTRQVGSGGMSNNLQSLSYQWDTVGNLAQRQDLKQSLTEVFTNDSLNRLQSSTRNGSGNLALVIDNTGNITSRTEGGITYPYTYDPVHKHAVISVGTGVNQTAYAYDANGNMSSRGGKTIAWTSYNMPTVINGSGVSAAFQYGPDRQRKQQTATYAGNGTTGTETTIYFADLFELETTPGQTHYKHNIDVPGGTRIIYDIQTVSGVKTTYLTADHLGSANLMLSSAGLVLANLSFSAYGSRRAANWAGPLSSSSADYTTIASTTRRGYSDAFHELLDNVGLTHMNGRVYDPVIGRFASPDPKPGAIENSQSWNSFGYVFNRPLLLTDPSGYDVEQPKLPMDGTDLVLPVTTVTASRGTPPPPPSSLPAPVYGGGTQNVAHNPGGGSGNPNSARPQGDKKAQGKQQTEIDPNSCNSFFSQANQQFLDTNRSLPGIAALPGLGLLTARAVSNSTGLPTLGDVALEAAANGGRVSLGAEFAIYHSAVNFALVSSAFEAGVYVGTAAYVVFDRAVYGSPHQFCGGG